MPDLAAPEILCHRHRFRASGGDIWRRTQPPAKASSAVEQISRRRHRQKPKRLPVGECAEVPSEILQTCRRPRDRARGKKQLKTSLGSRDRRSREPCETHHRWSAELDMDSDFRAMIPQGGRNEQIGLIRLCLLVPITRAPRIRSASVMADNSFETLSAVNQISPMKILTILSAHSCSPFRCVHLPCEYRTKRCATESLGGLRSKLPRRCAQLLATAKRGVGAGSGRTTAGLA